MKVISVSQLNRYVKSLLEGDANLAAVYIGGEISNFTNHYKSGHLYMSLKDEGAVVKAVMFRAYASKLAFTPENGMKVIVRARVSLYEKDGAFQIYIEEMQPDGVGALQIAFEQLKKKLAAEGLFEASRKKPLPRYPARVGVITSPTGAAVRDIFNVLGRRFPLARVVFTPVLVQGEGAHVVFFHFQTDAGEIVLARVFFDEVEVLLPQAAAAVVGQDVQFFQPQHHAAALARKGLGGQAEADGGVVFFQNKALCILIRAHQLGKGALVEGARQRVQHRGRCVKLFGQSEKDLFVSPGDFSDHGKFLRSRIFLMILMKYLRRSHQRRLSAQIRQKKR